MCWGLSTSQTDTADFHWGWSGWLTSCQERTGTRSLDETGAEAEPDSQSLNFSWKTALESSPCCQFRFSSLLVPKLLFSLISLPKRGYYILQIRASDLKFLMPILFRPWDGEFPVPLISPHEAMAAISSQLHHFHLQSCLDPMLCSRSLLNAAHSAAWSNPGFFCFCSVFTAPQPFFLLHGLNVCGWKTSEAFFRIKNNSLDRVIWQFSFYLSSPLPQRCFLHCSCVPLHIWQDSYYFTLVRYPCKSVRSPSSGVYIWRCFWCWSPTEIPGSFIMAVIESLSPSGSYSSISFLILKPQSRLKLWSLNPRLFSMYSVLSWKWVRNSS